MTMSLATGSGGGGDMVQPKYSTGHQPPAVDTGYLLTIVATIAVSGVDVVVSSTRYRHAVCLSVRFQVAGV